MKEFSPFRLDAVQPEVLKSHIPEIRSVLGDDAKKPLFLEAMSRRGYRFIAPVTEGVPAGRVPPSRPSKISLVGRERPLSERDQCLGGMSRGERQIVFVTGEPGIGKTAVMELPDIRIVPGQCEIGDALEALAWEASARVAMAGGDHHRAHTCLETALSTMEGFEVPLAIRRVHASAAELEARLGNERATGRHCSLARATVLALATSLVDHERLRDTFLASPPVRAIVGPS